MRFSGVRQVPAPVETVWAALHDPAVLRAAIPGCERLLPEGPQRYAAVLAARVGPVADTYRGGFVIEDLCPAAELRVRVEGRGRCGQLQVDLRVRLESGRVAGTTALRYDAHAGVKGLVSRLGNPTLTVAGAHLTGCFFRDLDRSLCSRGARSGPRSAMATPA